MSSLKFETLTPLLVNSATEDSAPASSSAITPYPLADFKAHRQEILQAIERVATSGNYILGPEVDAFEREFAQFLGIRHAIGVGSGTDAIEILLRSLDLRAGDHVAVPAHTAPATVAALVRAGVTPVLVDVEPATYTISPHELARTVRALGKTRLSAVLAVHLYGHPADLSGLAAVCAKYGLTLIEDCAQAHGATYCGQLVGSVGRAAAFSFYPTKNLGAIGDAGAITTNDDLLANKVRAIRQYGWRRRQLSEFAGVNSRLDELQAAVLRIKLKSLPASIERRRYLASIYQREINCDSDLKSPSSNRLCGHAFHLYVVRSPKRDQLMNHLTTAGVPVAIHYPAPVHLQPAWRALTKTPLPLRQAELLAREVLSLPLHPYLKDESVRRVVTAVEAFRKASTLDSSN